MTISVSATSEAGWRAGVDYLGRGIQIVKRSPWLYLQLVVLFAAPAVASAVLNTSGALREPVRSIVLIALDFFPAQVASPVMMMAVAAGYRGEPLTLPQTLGRGLRWLPRYMWTNVHTSALFWIPGGVLIALQQRHIGNLPAEGGAAFAVSALLVGALIGSALWLQCRTSLAAFLAVHGNQPATLATLNSWRLGHQYPARILGTFLVGVAPVVVPLGLLLGILLVALRQTPSAQAALIAMLPSLAWAVIQLIRPVLVPSLYLLYRDTWAVEGPRRIAADAPATPRFLEPLLQFSAWLPQTAGRLVGRPNTWVL